MSSLPHLPTPSNPRLVCVVDPDPRTRRRVTALLEPLGAQIHAYGTAGEFLASLDDVLPACVVADSQLPDRSGRELLADLRARGLRIPTVLLSEDADISSAVTAIRAGAVDYIEKPFIDHTLLNHVSAILGLDDQRH